MSPSWGFTKNASSRERKRERDRETERQRERQRQRDTETERETETDTETETDRERVNPWFFVTFIITSYTFPENFIDTSQVVQKI